MKRMKEDLFYAMDRCMNSRRTFKNAYREYNRICLEVSDKIMDVFKIAQAELKDVPPSSTNQGKVKCSLKFS